jgi:hypothetical protein
VSTTDTASDQPLSLEQAALSIIQPETPVEAEAPQEDPAVEEPDQDDVEVVADDDQDTVDETADDADADDADADDEVVASADEDPDDVDDEEPEYFTVMVDGKEEEVTLQDLKAGYSGQKYVQKGMQDAAAQRKEAEAVYQQLINERQQISQLYQQLSEGGIPAMPAPPDESLLEVDPVGYIQEKDRYEQRLAEYQQSMQKMQQVAQQQSAAEQAAQQAYIQRELESLRVKIPELADPNTAAGVHQALTQAGDFYGYTADELGGVIDSRALHVLHDAMKYRQIVEGKNKADRKAKRKPQKVIKPGARKRVSDTQTQARRKQRDRFKQSGRIEDAVDLIFKE